MQLNKQLKVNGIYRAKNQGMTITPQSCNVEVVWYDSNDVWYRKENNGTIQSTPIDRFLEIAE